MQKILKNTDIRKTIEMLRNGEFVEVPFRIKDYVYMQNMCYYLRRKKKFVLTANRMIDATKVTCIYNPLITKR